MEDGRISSSKKSSKLEIFTCKVFTTRFRAFLSYFLPMVYGISLFSIAWLKVSSPMFVAVCLAFGSIDVITSIVGMIGVLCPSGLAIRSTIPLLAMENLVTFLISIGLFVESILYKEYSKEFLILDFSVGLTVSFVLMLSTILSVMFIWKITDYLNDLEATNIFEELANRNSRSSKFISSINRESSIMAENKPLLNKGNGKELSKSKIDNTNNDVKIDIEN
ncbi:hypothetical protein FG386_002385 [Cryptosporidium ryanae]|uniref:uncharacterized protein n=1 Tax=Cryptosporidium ryanae TaxID=515981 RepID=UPI00351A8C70|nr:hypothetical protein FG386_002385 [Cryptosporidium ryanae]